MKAIKGGWIEVPILENSTKSTLLTSISITRGSELVVCDKSLALKRGNVGEVTLQGIPWELTSAKYVGYLHVCGEGTLEEAFISTNGTKLYYVIAGEGKIYQYHLRVPWYIISGVYDANFDVSSWATDLTGLYFSPDGTKMFITTADTDKVYRFDLYTPWDITSATYNSEFSVSSKEDIPTGVYFKEDGTIMFVVGWKSGYVLRFDLSTPWDITTANYVSQFYVKDQDSIVDGLFFSSDGSKMFIAGRQKNKVYQYNLSTAWDITTAYFAYDFKIEGDGSLFGLYFSPDGSNLYVSMAYWKSSHVLQQFSLRYYQADISEFSFDDVPIRAYKKEQPSVYVSKVYEQEQNENDWCQYQVSLVEKPKKLVILEGTTNEILKTNEMVVPNDIIVLFDGSNFTTKCVNSVYSGLEKVKTLNLSEILYEGSNDISNNMAATFSSDGLFLFVINNDGSKFDKFALSSPWNLSTAKHVARASFIGNYGWIHGMIKHPTEPYFYILYDASPDKIVQYTIDENLNINEVNSHNLSSEYGITGGMTISPDGKYLVMCVDGYGTIDSALVLWRFGTPWDISSIYNTNKVKDISSVLKEPYAISASSDGKKIFVSGYDSNFRIFVFSLSIPWDVSTATLEYEFDVSKIVPPHNSYKSGIEYLIFGDNGKKLYIGQRNYSTITQINLFAPYDVSSYWIVDISSFNLTNPPTKAWKKPTKVYIALEPNTDRCLYQDEDISDKIQNATSSSFEFQDTRENLIKVGDTLVVNGNNVQVTNVTYDASTHTYEVTVPDQGSTITSVIIPARTELQTSLENRSLDTNDDTRFISKYSAITKIGRALRIKIEGKNETEVNHIQVDLWIP